MELDQGGESANALKKLHEEAGWPSSRIILTYQSFDAARSRAAGHTGLLPGLGRLLGNTSLKVSIYGEPYTFTGPYAGVLGWPAQVRVTVRVRVRFRVRVRVAAPLTALTAP